MLYQLKNFKKEPGILIKLFFLLLCLSVMIVLTGCTSKNTQDKTNTTIKQPSIIITDDTGKTIHLEKPVTRVVTQSSDTVEMLVAFGAKEKIVGVADYVKKHNQTGKYVTGIESIGDSMKPDVEKLIALNPDVFLVKGSKITITDQLRDSNITIISLDFYRIPLLASDARALGNLTGTSAQAEKYAQYVEKNLDLIKTRVNKNIPKGTLNVYSESYMDYGAQGLESGGTQILDILNAKNICGDTIPGQNSIVSAEWIIDRNPDVIVKIASQANLETESLDQIRTHIMTRPGFDQINAVKNGRVYVINGDLLYSPRGAAGIMYLAKAFYPELFTDINPDDVLKEYATSFFPDANNIPTIATSS